MISVDGLKSNRIITLKENISIELNSILNYWENRAVDHKNGGFIGQIDCNDIKVEEADKGSVLNARILWTFSSAYQITNNPNHLALAKRAFEYVSKFFYDPQYGGVYWNLSFDGTVKDGKKQIYAIAFTIYGLSEYFKITKDEKALNLAVDLFRSIEDKSYDRENKGYFEAFKRNWEPIEDLRLSEKDANEKKTMNTHLHIVEAYANLYLVWSNENLKQKIVELLEIISVYFINSETGHLKLFFDENWVEKPDVISYGHDIEAAWLLQWCAEVVGDKALIKKYKEFAVIIAQATKEGIDNDGGLWYEMDPKSNELIAEKHWWPQAELWIGMINAWQLTGDEEYLSITEKNFGFVQNHIVDKLNGEWIWGIEKSNLPILKDKAGFWKCPYHNVRACIELINRL